MYGITLKLKQQTFSVIDVYQEWCGPVSALLGTFRRIKNEIGDDLLKFVVVSHALIGWFPPVGGAC